MLSSTETCKKNTLENHAKIKSRLKKNIHSGTAKKKKKKKNGRGWPP